MWYESLLRGSLSGAYWGGKDRKSRRLLGEGVGGSKMSSSSEASGESKVSSGDSGRGLMSWGGRSATSSRGGGPSSSSSSDKYAGAGAEGTIKEVDGSGSGCMGRGPPVDVATVPAGNTGRYSQSPRVQPKPGPQSSPTVSRTTLSS